MLLVSTVCSWQTNANQSVFLGGFCLFYNPALRSVGSGRYTPTPAEVGTCKTKVWHFKCPRAGVPLDIWRHLFVVLALIQIWVPGTGFDLFDQFELLELPVKLSDYSSYSDPEDFSLLQSRAISSLVRVWLVVRCKLCTVPNEAACCTRLLNSNCSGGFCSHCWAEQLRGCAPKSSWQCHLWRKPAWIHLYTECEVWPSVSPWTNARHGNVAVGGCSIVGAFEAFGRKQKAVMAAAFDALLG